MLLLILSPIRQAIYLKKENTMVEVTEAATKQIAEYFKGKEVAPIRIFLNSGG
jgi:hypothetical protein